MQQSSSIVALSQAQLESYHNNGYVVLRGFFSKAVLAGIRPSGTDAANAAIAKVVRSSEPMASNSDNNNDIVKRSSNDDDLFKRCVVYGCAMTGEDPNQIVKLEGLGRLEGACTAAESLVWPIYKHCCCDPRFETIAKQVLGSKVELMKDKYIFKAAGVGSGFPPHQDMTFIYNRVCTEAVNFGIAFDDADASNGALEVCVEQYAETHGRHVLERTETKMDDEVVDHLRFEHVNTQAGDVIMFSGWLLHRSTANATTRDRNVYYVTYGLPGIPNRPAGSLYSDYYELYDKWIELGYPSGQEADTLLGDDPATIRPTLIPKEKIGCGAPKLKSKPLESAK